MKTSVYVDGQHGTTGLEVNQYLEKHPNIVLIKIAFDDRRNNDVRKEMLNKADVVILCLPDDAAKESVSMIENDTTRVIDASTAHRINEEWIYGIPELGHREAIKTAKRVANPGCHASASALLLKPLVEEGIIDANYPVAINSITGYSGGGKQMIKDYEVDKPDYINQPRPYALTLSHKHLKEMKTHIGLNRMPLFTPVVANYYKGLVVYSLYHIEDMKQVTSIEDIVSFYKKYYQGEEFISIYQLEDKIGTVANTLDLVGNINTNKADIFVYGNAEQVMLVCRIDNLGKGASGAAIQNLNIMIGTDEDTTLVK